MCRADNAAFQQRSAWSAQWSSHAWIPGDEAVLEPKHEMGFFEVSETANSIDLSIIIPTRNETASLESTVDLLVNDEHIRIHEIVLILAADATDSCELTASNLTRRFPALVRLARQQDRGLGRANRLGIQLANGTHMATMFADLESDPSALSEMFRVAEKHPNAIVNASRWLKGGKFIGYSRTKLILNWLAQSITKRLFNTSVSDFTFGYRIYPRHVAERLMPSEGGHGFQYEILLKAVKGGYEIREVPTTWQPRREGTATGHLYVYWPFLRIAVQQRWRANSRDRAAVRDVPSNST